jgi:2-C-methyl-D-erythritol 4-phosphate cytidylyltransferase
LKTVALVTAESHGAGETTELSLVRGEAMLTHAVRGLLDSGYVDLVVVATRAGRVVMSEQVLRPLGIEQCRVVAADSTKQAFEILDPAPFDVFLIHDASRAFTPPSVVRAVVDAVRAGAPAVVPVLPMSDTVKLVAPDGVIIGTQDREPLRTAQSPLGFTEDALRSALASGERDLLTGCLHTVPGHPHAMRVVTPFDVTLAEAVLSADRHEESL